MDALFLSFLEIILIVLKNNSVWVQSRRLKFYLFGCHIYRSVDDLLDPSREVYNFGENWVSVHVTGSSSHGSRRNDSAQNPNSINFFVETTARIALANPASLTTCAEAPRRENVLKTRITREANSIVNRVYLHVSLKDGMSLSSFCSAPTNLTKWVRNLNFKLKCNLN